MMWDSVAAREARREERRRTIAETIEAGQSARFLILCDRYERWLENPPPWYGTFRLGLTLCLALAFVAGLRTGNYTVMIAVGATYAARIAYPFATMALAVRETTRGRERNFARRMNESELRRTDAFLARPDELITGP